jgi:hypothetical protein
MADTWSVTADDLRDVGTALKYEEDGARLRRGVGQGAADQAVAPAVAEAKGRVMAMGTVRAAARRRAAAGGGRPPGHRAGQPGRPVSRRAGARVQEGHAARLRQRARSGSTAEGGWRHPVPHRMPKGVEGPARPPTWVHQLGAPGWFDDPLQARKDEYRQAVERAVKDMADRIRGAA